MRIGRYVVRPDGCYWVVATLKTFVTGSRAGQEYEADVVYPARFDQALRTLLDRSMRDAVQPDDTLEQAVGKVEHLYGTIGSRIPPREDSSARSLTPARGNVPEGASRS